MTLEVVQRFSPEIENPRIPTVNMNISDSEKVVWVQAEEKAPNDFFGPDMQIVDMILSKVDSPRDGLGPNWSPLERVVHRGHMEDLWAKLMTVFQETLKPSQKVCDCLYGHVEENGIYQAVKWVADHYESGTPITLLGRDIPKLEDASSWKVWKERLLEYYDNDSMNDASMFLRCVV